MGISKEPAVNLMWSLSTIQLIFLIIDESFHKNSELLKIILYPRQILEVLYIQIRFCHLSRKSSLVVFKRKENWMCKPVLNIDFYLKLLLLLVHRESWHNFLRSYTLSLAKFNFGLSDESNHHRGESFFSDFLDFNSWDRLFPIKLHSHIFVL